MQRTNAYYLDLKLLMQRTNAIYPDLRIFITSKISYPQFIFDKPDARRQDVSGHKVSLAGTQGNLTNVISVVHRATTRLHPTVVDVRLPRWIIVTLCYGLT